MSRLWLFLLALFATPLLASTAITAAHSPADVQQLLTGDGADIVSGDQVVFQDGEEERHHWQCNARAVLDDTDTFLGTGLTEAGAASRAEANCNLHLHLACYVVSCTHFIRAYDIQLGEE